MPYISQPDKPKCVPMATFAFFFSVHFCNQEILDSTGMAKPRIIGEASYKSINSLVLSLSPQNTKSCTRSKHANSFHLRTPFWQMTDHMTSIILGSQNNTTEETNGVNNAVSCYKDAEQFNASFVCQFLTKFVELQWIS